MKPNICIGTILAACALPFVCSPTNFTVTVAGKSSRVSIVQLEGTPSSSNMVCEGVRLADHALENTLQVSFAPSRKLNVR